MYFIFIYYIFIFIYYICLFYIYIYFLSALVKSGRCSPIGEGPLPHPGMTLIKRVWREPVLPH